MDIIDPGHKFGLNVLDGESKEILTFVKRNDPPEKYPGNIDAYSGTTIQEVLRVLISRVKYLDNQSPCRENKGLIYKFRSSLKLLEERNAIKKGRVFRLSINEFIENLPVCTICLHLKCEEHLNEL